MPIHEGDEPFAVRSPAPDVGPRDPLTGTRAIASVSPGEYQAGLRSRQWLPLPGAAAQAAICLLGYERTAFSSEAFAMAGLDLPASVARSVPKRQAEFFFGRLAARHALAAHGRGECAVPIGPAREPRWPEGLIGSITHAGSVAAAVVLEAGRHKGIGIDVEELARGEESLTALLSTALDASERHLLTSVELPFEMAVTLAFSAKESLFKAAYASVGRYFDFSAARLHRIDAKGQTLTLEITEALCESLDCGVLCTVSYRPINAEIVLTSCLHG